MRNSNIPNLLLCIFLPVLFCCRKSDLYIKKAKPEVNIGGGDARMRQQQVLLSKDTVYVLTSGISRDSGQSLSIEAGTLIKVNDKVSIAINPGATILAKGTISAPIVFTSSALKGTPGIGAAPNEHYWNGITIAGKKGVSSGTLEYTRIEFSGSDGFTSTAALHLLNVDSSTVISHVQVSYSYTFTNAIEFDGGNCQANYLIAYASAGSDFYCRNGYKGKLQFLVAYRHPFFPAFANNNGIQLAGLRATGAGTNPIISNLTVLGPDDQKNADPTYHVIDDNSGSPSRIAAFVVSDGALFQVQNSVFSGFPVGGFFLGERQSAIALNDEVSNLRFSVFQSTDTARIAVFPSNIFPPFKSADLKTLLLRPAYKNRLFGSLREINFNQPFNYSDGTVGVLPASGSPLLSGSGFDNLPVGERFLQKVSFVGAMGVDDWSKGWSNFIPLQTDYNN